MEATEKKYRITMTESQLRLMMEAVEDWHRFLAGQCDMDNATAYIEDCHEARKNLDTFVRPYIVPELKHRGSSYSWDGGQCPREHQRRAIAMSYMLWREPMHYFTIHNCKEMPWSCYNSETLTCPEQGPLIKIEEVNE